MSKARLVVTAVIVEKRKPAEVARSYGVARSWVYTLLVIIWHLLAGRAARFEDPGDDCYLNTIDTGRRARSHIRQLQAPGFTVTITPAAA